MTHCKILRCCCLSTFLVLYRANVKVFAAILLQHCLMSWWSTQTWVFNLTSDSFQQIFPIAIITRLRHWDIHIRLIVCIREGRGAEWLDILRSSRPAWHFLFFPSQSHSIKAQFYPFFDFICPSDVEPIEFNIPCVCRAQSENKIHKSMDTRANYTSFNFLGIKDSFTFSLILSDYCFLRE